MLLGAVAGHGILRRLQRESDLGFLVNIAGKTALVVGAVIVVWGLVVVRDQLLQPILPWNHTPSSSTAGRST
jgi:hypothetical protein